MKKRLFLLTLLGVLAMALAATAAAAPLDSTRCIDCHLNETRDYDYTSLKSTTWMVKGHPPALEHPVTECGPCHSAEYILAPGDNRPQRWEDVSAGITCVVCHLDHAKGEKPGDRALPTCEQCHSTEARGSKLGALIVYNPQREVFRGLAPAFLETVNVPNRWHSKQCADCHMPKVAANRRGHTFQARMPRSAELTCGQTGCHEGRSETYTDMARGWQREVDRGLREIRSQLAAKKNLSAASQDNLKHYQIAKFEHDTVMGDLSLGVHNIDYARHLIAEAKRHLAAIK